MKTKNMKYIILSILVWVAQAVSAQSCADTCSYKSYFMYNNDTTKYSILDITRQGLIVTAENTGLSSAVGLLVDSYKGNWKLEGQANGKGSFIASNEDIGLEMESTEDMKIRSVKSIELKAYQGITVKAGNSAQIQIINNNSTLIIKATGLPTSCSGQTSGTWYLSNGFLKVCP